ncbi:hypothetical protein JCM10212_004425, partial [Sporobolomyces blumeae]
WKTTPSLVHPTRFANPLWSYSLGLAQGWIPSNPRLAAGFCYSYAKSTDDSTSLPRPRAVKAGQSMEQWKVGRWDVDERKRRIADVDAVQGTGGEGTAKDRGKHSRGEFPWPPRRLRGDQAMEEGGGGRDGDEEGETLDVYKLPSYVRGTERVVLSGLDPDDPYSGANARLARWHVGRDGCEYPDAWDSTSTEARWSIKCIGKS